MLCCHQRLNATCALNPVTTSSSLCLGYHTSHSHSSSCSLLPSVPLYRPHHRHRRDHVPFSWDHSRVCVHFSMCVCVCVRARACVKVYLCACMCVCVCECGVRVVRNSFNRTLEIVVDGNTYLCVHLVGDTCKCCAVPFMSHLGEDYQPMDKWLMVLLDSCT